MLGQEEEKLITSWKKAQTEPIHLVYTQYNSRYKTVSLHEQFHYSHIHYVKILLKSRGFCKLFQKSGGRSFLEE